MAASLSSDLITVVIPTRERADTLEYCLRTCVAQEDERFRILVSDNASDDGTRRVIEKFAAGDARVEYINPGRRLGMSEHWEFALEHISEGFVSVLGDDDALFPDALPTMRRILTSWPETKAISWPYSFYGYPSLFTSAKDHLGLEFGEGSKVRDSREWLASLAAFDVSYFELPMVYYGLVRASVLDEIRARTGRLISSFIPDVYLAVAVACVTESYYRVSRSLSLCGTSHHSNGAASITVGEESSIVKAFLSETGLTPHPMVPYFSSIPAFVLESLFSARDAGLLPADVHIDLENAVGRIFVELHGARHSPELLEQYLQRLRKLCEGIDQTDLFERLTSFDSRAREVLAEKLAIREGHPKRHILINLENTAVTDVASAVSLAFTITRNEPLQKVWQRMSNEMREVHAAFNNQVNQLRELEALARRQENKLEARHLEFLEQIASVGRELEQSQTESTSRFHQIEKLTELLKVSEADRAHRFSQLSELDALARDQQKQLERRHLEFTERIALLDRELEQTRAESAARLHQIEKLTEMLNSSEKDRSDRPIAGMFLR
jgi:hypothetical protein